MRRSLIALPAVSALVLAAVVLPSGGSGAAPQKTQTGVDSTAALVQLVGVPLSINAATRPSNGKLINLRSAAVKSERAKLSAIRNDFRTWLKAHAPAARITNETDLAVHTVSLQLNGTSLATLRSAPLVRHVELQRLFTTMAHQDPDLSLIHTKAAWNAVGGSANAGAGVRVAVIDSGIDVTHPCFDDAGYPNVQQRGNLKYTNNKVIVARVYGNKVTKNGYDAGAVNGHGTHVAGTIACNAHTPAVIDGVEVPYDPSGVAPRAVLGSYNVFPGDEGSGRSEDILEAMEDAYADGFRIANMSLGGARNDGGGAFLLDNAVNNLDRANMVLAVAAGNEGPGYFTVHYPGAAQRALTAGASTVGHNIINIVTVAGHDYEAVVGDFASVETDLSAPLKVVADADSAYPHKLSVACDPPFETLPNGIDLTGKIALLGRGDCDFTVKMRNAQEAGAVGVIIVNRIEGEAPFLMSHNDLEPRPTIPGVMVSLEDGLVMAEHNGASTTIHALGVYITTPADTNRMAGFSSWGPTHGDLLIKPDVVAPGADVVSSFPAATCEEPERSTVGCWTFLGGTSMATPHLAGIAAVVRGAHPAWTAAQVRSAVVNTAQQNLLRDPNTDDVTNDPQIVGAGLADAAAAVAAVSALDPVSASFGHLSSGSGSSRSSTMQLTNISHASHTYTVSTHDSHADGVTFSGGRTVTLAPGASATFVITARAVKGVADGHKWATVRVSTGGDQVAHAMVYALVGEGDAAPGRHMLPPPKA